MGTEVLLMQVLLLWGIMDVDEVGVGFVVQGAVAVRSMAVFGLAVDVTFKNSVHSFSLFRGKRSFSKWVAINAISQSSHLAMRPMYCICTTVYKIFSCLVSQIEKICVF